ncbi:MAG: hypothetical protein LAT50_19450 [Ectothiorhodospiraceae bacterium]|nr:hypothetical protein [Ectothiorhodospiraceae bacterium]
MNEDRREHLLRLMNDYRLTCRQVAVMLDRKPHTVRCWRCGHLPINDHTLALLELLLRYRYQDKRKAA